MSFEEEYPSLQKEDFEFEQCVITGKKRVDVEEVIDAIQKHTVDKQRMKKVLLEELTSTYEGQVAVQPEYHSIIKKLGLED